MLRVFGIAVLSAALALVAPHTAAAQAQAANGNIEGTVRDSSGASLPGVMVTVTNMETGTTRSVVTNESGVYRAPLLPLGRYRVSAELQGFKTFEQQGITLSAGQTALINVELSVGNVSETVTVSSESPIAQPGKIDLGRTIGEQEVRNLPLISRNPYNFAFLQANVTGYENNEFGVPRINANGSQMHTNYQLDGNTNTEKDRAGLRMLPISEALVREVKVITNGFAPEFGQTTGMVYNAITPSGTNDLHGSTSFRFRRNPMSSRPFFLSPTARKPDTEVNDFNAALGGPVVRDKIHFFGAYEYVDRSLVTGGQVITVDPAAAQTLGITLPADGVIPAHQKVNFLFGKTDYQINTANRLSARYFLFKNSSRLEHRRRPDDDGPRDGLHRSHGLRLRAARVEHRLLEVERAPGAVRPSTSVPHAGGLGGGRSRDYGQRRRQFRRASHRRRELGRLRLQSGHLAGNRQHDLAAREAQLQGGHRRAVHRRRSRKRRAVPVHLPEHGLVPRGEERGGATRVHQPAAGFRRPQRVVQLRVLRLLCAGRLATQPDDEAAVRPSVRRLRRAVVASVRRQPVLERLHDRQEQPRAARRLVLVARQPGQDRSSRVDRPDVRAAAARLLRQRDHEQRRSDQLHRYGGGNGPRRAGFPRQPGLDASGFRAAAPEHHGGLAGLPHAVRLAHQRADRARA